MVEELGGHPEVIHSNVQVVLVRLGYDAVVSLRDEIQAILTPF